MLRKIMKALWLCVFLYLFKKVSQYITTREIENVAANKISDDIPGIFHLTFFFFPFRLFDSLSLSLDFLSPFPPLFYFLLPSN